MQFLDQLQEQWPRKESSHLINGLLEILGDAEI